MGHLPKWRRKRKVGKVMKIEIEKPVIPQFVADWIESLYDEGGSEYTAIGIMLGFTSKHDKPVHDWFVYNKDTFINAVMFGYEIEQEPRYYAKIKGWEHVGTSSYYFGYDEDNDSLEVTYLESNYRFAFSLTKKQWNKIGVNDNNADFEVVSE